MLTDRELLLPGAIEASPPRGDRTSRTLHRVAFWCIILNIAAAALIAGLVLRRFAWDQTEPVRYLSDIDNAFRQGTQALREGYLARYTNQAATPEGDYEFDYAPGRLAIATLWTRWVRLKVDPDDVQYEREWPRFYSEVRSTDQQYELCRPLLVLNTIGEIASAIGMFLLVRQWTSGSTAPGILRWPQKRPARSAILGLISALFLWFNLALIWNAHCWPQWDSWLLPFFLWALVAASANYWFWAGMLIACGMMFKAQILFGAPLFIFWPLFRGQWLAIVRWIVGAATATAAITAVWLVRADDHVNSWAIVWVLGMGVSVVILWWIVRNKAAWFVRVPLAAIAMALVSWPLFRMGWMWVVLGWLALSGVALVLRFGSRRALPFTTAGWIAGALFVCVPVFGGNIAWFHIGIAYGTHRYVAMTRGSDNNLAAIMEKTWNWGPMDPVTSIPAGHIADAVGSILTAADPHFQYTPEEAVDVPLKYLLFGVYVVGILFCSFGAAIQSKRGSPRFLVAVSGPWIIFFAFLTQMHQRYLLWGAAMSAATVALGPGFALLHLLITAIAWSQEALDMLDRSRFTDTDVFKLISGWNPGIGWALLLCAAIFVYVAVTPAHKRV